MASNGKVKIISYDVNGLLNPIKRNKILTKMSTNSVLTGNPPRQQGT